MMPAKRGLGKGLDALFIDNATSSDSSTGNLLKITEIEPNRKQPRKNFDEEGLQQLADSIREHGLIQPLVVRPMAQGGYQLIAGERRWRACRMAGIKEVPVIIKDISDMETMEIALIENLQRENLNPIEEAYGYKELMEQFHLTQQDVSKSVGKSRSVIANTLRLLNLPKKVVDYVKEGKLSSGHARAILALEDTELMEKTAEQAITEELTVRDIEKIAQKSSGLHRINNKLLPASDNYYREVELAIKNELHKKIKIKEKENQGTIEISFFSREEFDDIIQMLSENKLEIGE